MKVTNIAFCYLFLNFILSFWLVPEVFASSVTLNHEILPNGLVKVVANANFDTCNGDLGSLSIHSSDMMVGYCYSIGVGSATCTYEFDRGSRNGSNGFQARASDCKGQSIALHEFQIDNTPNISVSEPGLELTEPFDFKAQVVFAPTLEEVKGYIAVEYITSTKNEIARKTCYTENCNLSYLEITGNLYDLPNSYWPFLHVIKAVGGGATAEVSKSLKMTKEHIVDFFEPNDHVSAPFDIKARVNFAKTISEKKGTIVIKNNAYGVGEIARKDCFVEDCTISYNEATGGNYDLSHSIFPYSITIQADGSGATASTTKNIYSDKTPTIEIISPEKFLKLPIQIQANANFKDTLKVPKGNIVGKIVTNYIGEIGRQECSDLSCDFNAVVGADKLAPGGNYLLSMTATGDGASATATQWIYICNTSATLSANKSEFYPALNDKVTFTGALNSGKPFTWQFSIADRVITGTGKTFSSFVWDGKDSAGKLLPENTYIGKLTITDSDGGCTETATAPVTILPADCKSQHPLNSSLNVASGNVSHSQALFAVKGGALPLNLSLSFQSLLGYDGPLGQGWSHNYDINLTEDSLGNVVLRKGLSGRSYLLDGGVYKNQSHDFSVLTKSAEGYLITETDGQKYRFNPEGRITAIEDRFGNALSFAYPAEDPTRTVISDPFGRQVTLHYRTDSLVIKVLPDGSALELYSKLDRITDPNGRNHNFTYHADSGRLWQVIAPEPKAGTARPTWTYLYDAAGYLEYKTDPEQNVVRYVYNADHTLKESYDPQLQKKSAVYNPSTSTTTVTEKDGGQWIYKYDPTKGVLLSKTDPAGNITSYTYYADGRELSRTEPGHAAGERLTVFSSYDAQGRNVAQTAPVNLTSYGLIAASIASYEQLATLSPPIKTAFRTSYDDAHFGRIANHSDERGELPLTTSYAYTSEADAADPGITYEVITVTDPAGKTSVTKLYPDGRIKSLTDGNGQLTSFTYHPGGLLHKVLDPRGGVTEYLAYDPLGNPRQLKVTDTTGDTRTIDLGYDALGRLTSTTQGALVTRFDYDGNGNRSYLKDAEGNETWYQNNYRGQVTTITDALLQRTELAYGGAGCASCGGGVDKLTAVIDANHTSAAEPRKKTSFAYTSTGQLKSETDPLGNTVLYTYTPSGKLKAKLRDANGNGEVDAGDPQILSYTYVPQGQVESKTDHLTGETTSFTYTPNGWLWTASNPHISYTFDYYATGWLKSVVDSQGRTIRYDQYDGIGQRDLVTLFAGSADEKVIDYGYDPQGRLASIAFGNQTFTLGYDGFSRRQSLTYPNGLVTSYGYNPQLDWLESLTTRNGGGQILIDLQYPLHDKVGNRKQRLEAGIATDYAYDPLYQLTQAKTGAAEENFKYDPVGNRTAGPTVKEPEGVSYQHDDVNRMLRGRKLSYSYDSFGNQRERIIDASKKWLLSWDGDNRLIRAELQQNGANLRTLSFKYDPFGRRIEKQMVDAAATVTTTYVYDGEDIVLEQTSTQAGSAAPTLSKTFYVHGPGIDEPLALLRDGQSHYYHADGLGSIVALSNAAGQIVQRYTYDAFGLPTATDPSFANSYAFTAREWDKELGLYYYRARYYDPMEGRFVSKDPIAIGGNFYNQEYDATFLQHVGAVSNSFAYVENNPANLVDPSGNIWVTAISIGVPVVFGGGMTWIIVQTIKKCAEKNPCNDLLNPEQRSENIKKCVMSTIHLTKFLGWESGVDSAISSVVNTAVQEYLEKK